MNIVIYTTTTCPHCNQLKDYLKEKSLPFSEKIIDQDEQAKFDMEKASGGFLGVPFTIINLDDGTTQNIIGFDKGKINSILGIK